MNISISKDETIEILWALDRTISYLWKCEEGNPLHHRGQIRTLNKIRDNMREQLLEVTND